MSGDSAGASRGPSISANGRFVAFTLFASNLVPGDTNETVHVHDRKTGITTLVSVDSAGNEGNGNSGVASISANGRFVTFTSIASNLVPGDTNETQDVFVHDRKTGITTRVSVDSAGNEGNRASTERGNTGSFGSSITANGRFVAFMSSASNLVPGDTNETEDVFVHDRKTGITTRVSVNSAGNEGNNGSFGGSISANGRFVAFESGASNLVPGDTNETGDVFVHDRKTGITTLVSVDSAGNEGNDTSFAPSLSANGRFVTFTSIASNLVPGDTNGVEDVFVHELARNALNHARDDDDADSVDDDDED